MASIRARNNPIQATDPETAQESHPSTAPESQHSDAGMEQELQDSSSSWRMLCLFDDAHGSFI